MKNRPAPPSPSFAQPTMADVAKHCGVSIMTVSNVVRGIQCVKQETVEKVQRALDELGYRPDPLLSSLSTYRARKGRTARKDWTKIVFLDSDPSDYTQRTLTHLEEASRHFGYSIENHRLPADIKEQQRLSRRLYYQGVRGILLGPSQREQHLDGFDIEAFTVVSIGALRHSPHFDSVSQDYFSGLLLAAEKCVEANLRNIALFVGEWHDERTGHKWRGAYRAFCDHYAKKSKLWLFKGMRPPSVEEFRSWIEGEKIEAVLTLSGCVTKYWEAQFDVRFVLLNDLEVPAGVWHLSVPLKVLAEEGLRLLDNHLRHRERGAPLWPRRVSIQAQWKGATIPPPADNG